MRLMRYFGIQSGLSSRCQNNPITSAKKENGTAKSVCGAVWTERATASGLPALGVAQHSKASALCHGFSLAEKRERGSPWRMRVGLQGASGSP